MAYLQQPYYVGLLSAAAYHGASQQRAQQYHVVTNQPVRKIQWYSLVIRFLTKSGEKVTAQERAKTATGMIQISTPEATTLDLVAYSRQAGGLDRVATVLQGLGEKLDPVKIVDAARQAGHMAFAQRLAWLLEQTEFADKASSLADWILPVQCIAHCAAACTAQAGRGELKKLSAFSDQHSAALRTDGGGQRAGRRAEIR